MSDAYKVMGRVEKIEDGVFSGCTELSSIALPDLITEIVVSAFENCFNLESVTLPDKLDTIGK